MEGEGEQELALFIVDMRTPLNWTTQARPLGLVAGCDLCCPDFCMVSHQIHQGTLTVLCGWFIPLCFPLSELVLKIDVLQREKKIPF